MNKIVIHALISGIIGGIIGGVISVLLAYYVLPFPEDVMHFVIGQGMAGFWSALMGGFMGVLVYGRKHASKVSVGQSMD